MSRDRVRFWLLLLPCIFAYLITDRSFKALLVVPYMWLVIDLLLNWKVFREEIQSRNLYSIILYALLVAISVFVGALFGSEKIIVRDVMIISSGLVLFLFPKEKMNAPEWLFVCFAGAYFYFLFGKNFDPAKIGDLFTIKIFLPNTAATEFDFGIVFGLFSVHFLLLKKWPWFFPSALVSLMVSKRALLLGFILSVFWWIFVGGSKKFSARLKSYSIIALYFSLMVFSLFMTELGQQALGWFGIENMNVGRFLMGRNTLILALRDHLDFSSLTAFFGHGPGAADTFLAYNGVGWGPISDQPFNPHNDYMKIIFDYGILGYLIFFAILINFYGGSAKGKALMVYTITVFCFDNALIFMVFHIVAGFMCMEYTRMENDAKRIND